MNRDNKESRLHRAAAQVKSVATKAAVIGSAAVGSALVLVGPAAASGGTGVDTTLIMAAIADSQTKGVAIAGAVTLMIFLFAAAKWLRRAK